MSGSSVLQKRLSLISLGLALAIALMAAVIFPAPAHAQDGPALLKATLTVQFIVTQTCAPGDAICSACVSQNSYYVEAQGLAETSMGPQFVLLFKCYNPNDGFGTYAGTLTTTAPNGKDSIRWAYSGENDNFGDFYQFGPFRGTLTIMAGTGKFAGARGSASFKAASGPTFAAATFGPGPSPVQAAGTAFYYLQGQVELASRN